MLAEPQPANVVPARAADDDAARPDPPPLPRGARALPPRARRAVRTAACAHTFRIWQVRVVKIVSMLRSRDKQEEQSLQPSAVGKKLNDLIVQKVSSPHRAPPVPRHLAQSRAIPCNLAPPRAISRNLAPPRAGDHLRTRHHGRLPAPRAPGARQRAAGGISEMSPRYGPRFPHRADADAPPPTCA